MPVKGVQQNGDICRACGLCCNGTLHTSVKLVAGDNLGALSVLTLEQDGDAIFFRQPCRAFCGEGCSIYADRPSVCRDYRCALLQKVDSGVVTHEQALLLVPQVKQLAERVASGFATLSEPPRLPQPLTLLLAAPGAILKDAAPGLLLDVGTLIVTLKKHFR